jgi:hypothetical protein
VYAVDDNYVIYFIGCELYYETMPSLQKDLGSADAALARINRLLDDNPTEGTREYDINISTLELAADAFEMFFCGERTEALEILNGIRDKLQAKEEGKRRLMYEVGTALITALAWILYLCFKTEGFMPAEWYPWMLAAALAMGGGLFSVCLNLGSLEVNVNQQKVFLLMAGATRSIVAFLAGVGLLLAMRSKVFAGITYKEGELPLVGDALQIAEMFFCFLAGFSESFVPNILSKSADAKAADAKTVADKAAADKAAADARTVADKAAADKAAADARTVTDKAAADEAAADARTVADKAASDKAAADAKTLADKAASDKAAADAKTPPTGDVQHQGLPSLESGPVCP